MGDVATSWRTNAGREVSEGNLGSLCSFTGERA
jgi:hypothetical protein